MKDSLTGRQADRKADTARWTDTDRHRQADRQADRKTDRCRLTCCQIDRQMRKCCEFIGTCCEKCENSLI